MQLSNSCAHYPRFCFCRCFSISIVVVIGNNAFGPAQYGEKVIPRMITLFQRGEPITVHGSGLQRRSFLYVQDFVDGVLCVIEHGENGRIYNIGAETELTILDLVNRIASAMNISNFQVEHVVDRPWNDIRYWVHSDALRSLGWSPKVSFEDGLRRTIQWHDDQKLSMNYFVEDYVIPTQLSIDRKVDQRDSLAQKDDLYATTATTSSQQSVHPEDHNKNISDIDANTSSKRQKIC